jgi:SAM-dependent methyltransferase
MKIEMQNVKEEISLYKQKFEEEGLKFRTNPWSENKKIKVLKLLGVPNLKAKLILDFACGTSPFAQYLKMSFDTVIGLDVAYTNLKIAKNINKSFEYICGDGANIPFKKKTFDAVFCVAILHHMPDPTPVLGEINRVLREEGVLFIAEGNYWNPLTFIQYQTKFGKGWKTEGHRPIDYISMKQKLTQSGFIVLRKKGINFAPPKVEGIWKVAKFMEPYLESLPLINMLGGSLLITAKKVRNIQ